MYAWIRHSILIGLLANTTARDVVAQEATHTSMPEPPPRTDPRSTENGVDPPCSDKPWDCGVPTGQKGRATRLFNEGNAFFDNGLYLSAIEKYREALESWNHPSIHYNLMLALVTVRLDPIEAYESAQRALRYEGRALEPEERKRAEDYLGILSGQITEIEIVCDEPGAAVYLDNQKLFTGPGLVRKRILPGPHQVVARKLDHLDTATGVDMWPEKPVTVELGMMHQNDEYLIERHWQPWKPWVVAGVGAGLTLIGSSFHWRAQVNNKRFATLFAGECSPFGCFPPDDSPELRELEHRYTWYRRISYGAYIAGGLTLAGGLVLAYLNRPKQVKNPEVDHRVRISITPDVLPLSGSAYMSLTF